MAGKLSRRNRSVSHSRRRYHFLDRMTFHVLSLSKSDPASGTSFGPIIGWVGGDRGDQALQLLRGGHPVFNLPRPKCERPTAPSLSSLDSTAAK